MKKRTNGVFLLTSMCVLAAATGAHAQDVPADAPAADAPVAETPAPVAAPAPESDPVEPAPAVAPTAVDPAALVPEAWRGVLGRFALHGWVDAGYTANFNLPASGRNFTPAVGSSASRHNEITVNHAALDLSMVPEPVGFRLIVAAGTGNEFLHSFETITSSADPEPFEMIHQASVTWNTPLEGLSLEAGILPSHLGAEVMQNKDNWTYTRSWMGDLVPFYNAGLRVGYASGPLVANAYVLNGWGIIGDNNQGKSLGSQLGFVSDVVTVYLNGWAGPELNNDDESWRFFGDTVAIVNPASFLSILASADVGYQMQPEGTDDALWWGAALAARVKPSDYFAATLRGDVFGDDEGFMTLTPQTLAAGTLDLDLMPAQGLILRLEGRFDYSTAEVFETAKTATNSQTEALVSTGLIASF